MALLKSEIISTILDVLNYGITEKGVLKIRSAVGRTISPKEIRNVKERLAPLRGIQLEILRLPRNILVGFEPSQIGTIVGTIMDAAIPQLKEILPKTAELDKINLEKHAGILGEREGYPDFKLTTGERLELKLIYMDPVDVQMK